MDPLGAAVGDIIDQLDLPADLNLNNKEPLSMSEYLKMVDWTEPWLVALIIFHLLMLLIIVHARNNITIQSVLGMMMLAVVYMSETINQLAAENWQRFSAHQYFDSKGFFISTILSGPLLFNCLIIVVNFLMHNYYIMRDLQRLKISRSQKVRKSDSTCSGNSASSTSEKPEDKQETDKDK